MNPCIEGSCSLCPRGVHGGDMMQTSGGKGPGAGATAGGAGDVRARPHHPQRVQESSSGKSLRAHRASERRGSCLGSEAWAGQDVKPTLWEAKPGCPPHERGHREALWGERAARRPEVEDSAAWGHLPRGAVNTARRPCSRAEEQQTHIPFALGLPQIPESPGPSLGTQGLSPRGRPGGAPDAVSVPGNTAPDT